MTSISQMRQPLSVVGCDEGFRWTGLVLRHGGEVLTGATLGPLDRHGNPDPTAHDADDVSGLPARIAYVRSVVATIQLLVEESERQGLGTPTIACEAILPPKPRAPHAQRTWLVPTAVMYGVLGAFPAARVVGAAPARKSEHYPAALVGKPPEHWLGNAEPKRRRDHERSAYDIAEAFAWGVDR